MFILFDVKDLDGDSKKSMFYSLLTKCKYDVKSSTALMFNDVHAYEINIFTKEIRTCNRLDSCFSKLNKSSYYIEVKK